MAILLVDVTRLPLQIQVMKLLKSFVAAGALALATLAAGAADVIASAPDLSTNVAESYQIRNVKYGDLLRPRDANAADGTAIVLYPAEPWKCMTWKLLPAGDSVYRVKNHFTGKTFQVSGDEKLVQIAFAKDEAGRPAWRFTKLPDGFFEISDVKSGRALTAIGDGDSVHIEETNWETKPEQKWNLEKIDPATLTM